MSSVEILIVCNSFTFQQFLDSERKRKVHFLATVQAIKHKKFSVGLVPTMYPLIV